MTAINPTGPSHVQRLSNASYDVAVIGAGIVGAAIARELAGYQLSVALIEARGDVGDVTSKANTALLHTGYDSTPGTLESQLVRRGYELLSEYATRTGIPVERTGALLVAWNQDELDALPGLQDKAEAQRLRALSDHRRRRGLSPATASRTGALGALTVPDESIICTWTASLALATDARLRGTELLLEHRVDRVEAGTEHTVLHTTGGEVRARYVVNAAGLGSDTIDGLFGHQRFTVTPRRGELLVFDKLSRPLVNRIVLAVPTKLGKGVLISPTIYGNVMLGPTAENLTDKTATGTSEDGSGVPARQGQDAHAPPVRRGGHRHLRRTQSHNRPQRLPDRDRARSAVRARRRAFAPPG